MLCLPEFEFGSIANDGNYPLGQPVLVGSNLYGLTRDGGTADWGSIYSLNTNTWLETPVYSFTGGTTNGAAPESSLIASGAMLYGTTLSGGSSGNGIVFSYWTGATRVGQSRFNILHSFAGKPVDGATPYGRLLLSGTTLYGTASYGGTNDGGVLFSLNTDGSGYAILHHFTSSSQDGARPYSGVVQQGAYLYGVAPMAGAAGYGIIYSYYTGPAAPGANRFQVLHHFAGAPADGAFPAGGLVLAGTNLYGMAYTGGISNNGTLYRISAGGSGYTNLLQFTGAGTTPASGKSPATHNGLTVFGKYLFGTTYYGGANNLGTLFRLDLTVDPKLWLQTDAGQLAVWTLNSAGAQVRGGLMENTGAWLVRAAGDIDGDGVADLLFQDGSYNMAGWLMNADNTKKAASYWSNTSPWDLKACADFEGTGRAQVLFQKPDGSLALWRLNPDGSYNSSMGLGNSAPYVLRGAGDLDGDGKADLIFQNAAGNLAVWKHNIDGTISGATLPGAGTWLLRAVLDVNGNGISDIIWQAPDGNVAGWFVNAPVTPAGSFSPGGAGSYKVRAGGR